MSKWHKKKKALIMYLDDSSKKNKSLSIIDRVNVPLGNKLIEYFGIIILYWSI